MYLYVLSCAIVCYNVLVSVVMCYYVLNVLLCDAMCYYVVLYDCVCYHVLQCTCMCCHMLLCAMMYLYVCMYFSAFFSLDSHRQARTLTLRQDIIDDISAINPSVKSMTSASKSYFN